MNRIVFPVLLLAYFLHINSANSGILQNYELISSSNNITNGTNCTTTGLKCLNCYTSQLCIWNRTTGSYDEYLNHCYDGRTCSNGTCSYQHEPHCNGNTTNPPEFECRTPGMYPDPFDCKKYHYCVPQPKSNNSTNNSTGNSTLIKYSSECDCNFAYNALSKDCDIKIRNNSDCSWAQSVPSCYEKGQSGVVWHNSRIYYICLQNYMQGVLYPYLYACEHGKTYNSQKYICE